jgi:hypothetical protein
VALQGRGLYDGNLAGASRIGLAVSDDGVSFPERRRSVYVGVHREGERIYLMLDY